MKTTITLDFEGDNARELADLTRGVDLSTLLRDALGEFASARTPVEKYVKQRYAEADFRFRMRKQREVEKRIRVAELLGKADVTIEIANAKRFADDESRVVRRTSQVRVTLAAGDDHDGQCSKVVSGGACDCGAT